MNSTLSKVKHLGLDDSYLNSECLSRQAQNVINEAKRRDRPNMSLTDWNKQGYHKNGNIQSLFQCFDNIDRFDRSQLSQQRFNNHYQRNKIPILISGCAQNWKTQQKWNFNYFLQNYRQFKFKVGQDDDGQKIKIPFKIFMQYLVYNTDDSPLYLFQNTNVVHQQIKPILQNYRVPSYFQEDLFGMLGDEARPPYRWFLIGPERSGSTVHIDPMMTCAWNTSLEGRKRWVIFDADTPKGIVKGKEFRDKNEPDQAIYYFLKILPKIREKYSAESLGLREFIQYPGETVFVPGGAWHAVINLDDTIAVTQNFMNSYNFDLVWSALKIENRILAASLLQKIKLSNQILYNRILDLDKNKQSSVSFSGNDQDYYKYIINSNGEKSEKNQFQQIFPQKQTNQMKKSKSLGRLNEHKCKVKCLSEGKGKEIQLSQAWFQS